MKKYLLLTIPLLIVLFDQWSKYLIVQNLSWGDSIPIIPYIFNLTLVINKGAAFGFMAWQSDSVRFVLFKIIPIIVIIYFLYLLHKRLQQTFKSLKDHLFIVGTIFILGGAAGNMIDRFRLDYVVDFLDFYWKTHHFPAFNIADSAVSVGIFLLIIEGFMHENNHQKGRSRRD